VSTGDRDVVRRMEAAAAELRRRVQTVHERVACPKCLAPVGVRCVRANGQGTPGTKPLKHPHVERLRADGITDR
jgi:hypothetical protein